jgi:two-component system, response regulator YesN
MQRLLIVDDEPIILEGLYSYFKKADISDLEVIRAYSAMEAVDWMNTVKIDIVLSDISMPNMDGMELIQEIMDRWPRCKIILLTGFDEFEYAHQAIRNPCVVDYLLKTEGMGKIESAVRNALTLLSAENEFHYQAEWLRDKLPRALQQLQRQVLADVSRRSEGYERLSLQEEFDAIKLPFQSKVPVLPVIIRIEDWSNYKTDSDRSLIRYAVTNIAEELLQDKTEVKAFELDWQTIVCLIQPKPDSRTVLVQGELWNITLRFAGGTLETVQQACGDALHLSVSVVSAEAGVPWSKLSVSLHRLRLAIIETPGMGMEKLLRVPIADSEEHPSKLHNPAAASELLLEQLKQRILQGSDDWGCVFRKWADLVGETGPKNPFERMRVLHGIGICLMDTVHELDLADTAAAGLDMTRILHFDIQTSWVEIVSYYQMAFQGIVAKRNVTHRNDEMNMLQLIHNYINNNLEHDLSLTRIAQEVSLNPSYLSRWYKRATGKGISEYITEIRVECSQQLLLGTSLKMENISSKLGFSDPHYFYRFFKKAVGCTPQEFRDRNRIHLPNK